jgi:hypothetical protein
LELHLLERFQDVLPPGKNFTDPQILQIKKDRLYFHQMARFNYTTYDMRRNQDHIHVGTARSDVMFIDADFDGDPETSHPFWYGRVIKIFHVWVRLKDWDLGSRYIQYHRKYTLLQVLWVRCFEVDQIAGGTRSLDRLRWLEDFSNSPSSSGCCFISPDLVVRACHLVPQFNLLPISSPGQSLVCKSANTIQYRYHLINK